MKTTRGRWIADSESMILAYDNGRLGRVYCFPDGEFISPGEASAWIVGEDTPGVFSDDDIRNLGLALRDLLGFAMRIGPPLLEDALQELRPADDGPAMMPHG